MINLKGTPAETLDQLSVAKGSMGVQYLPWVINEHCLELRPILSKTCFLPCNLEQGKQFFKDGIGV